MRKTGLFRVPAQSLAPALALIIILSAPPAEAAELRNRLLAGYDSFIDRYTLIEDDTTDTVHEYYFGLDNFILTRLDFTHCMACSTDILCIFGQFLAFRAAGAENLYFFHNISFSVESVFICSARNHFWVLRHIRTSISITGTSISTPTTVARAAPEDKPKSIVEVAMATSK